MFEGTFFYSQKREGKSLQQIFSKSAAYFDEKYGRSAANLDINVFENGFSTPVGRDFRGQAQVRRMSGGGPAREEEVRRLSGTGNG